MRRVLVATLVVLPLALLAAGCGGDAVALDPVAQAAKKTQQQSSQQIEFTFSSAAGSGQGTGVLDKSGAGKVDFTFIAGGRTFTLNEISTSKLVIYLRSELFQRELPDGKSWLRVDLQREAKKLGLDLGSLSDANPSGGLQALRDASADVHEVGRETVAGAQTTHYGATIDLERAARNADDARAKSLRTLTELTGTKTIPIDVWVDGSGLVRRFREAYTVNGRSIVTDMTITRFGGPVDVQAPPDDQVLYAGDLR